jgi:hypothetical protein
MQAPRILVIVLGALAITLPCSAKNHPPTGILAASVGDSVVLIEPVSGRTVAFDTGPVGWLFPAPGGILFAPDVINARTTVISLLAAAVVDRIDGLTMPHFGGSPDRYVAVIGEIVVASYPDRAVIKTIPAEVHNPWQVIVSPDDAAMLVLERLPDGSTGVHITMVNLITRQVIQSRPLAGNIVHMALSPKLGLLALADADSSQIHLVEPATLTPMASRPVKGRPIDVVFARGGEALAAAVNAGDGTGTVDLTFFKSGKKGLRLDRESSIPLAAAPVRIDASPGGDHVAVALEGGAVVIVSVKDRLIVGQFELPGTPRDLRWCDPLREGPMIADWTDGEAPPDFGDFVPKDSGDSSTGLAEPVRKRPPN